MSFKWIDAKVQRPEKSGEYLVAWKHIAYGIESLVYTVAQYSKRHDKFICFDSFAVDNVGFPHPVDYWAEIPPIE